MEALRASSLVWSVSTDQVFGCILGLPANAKTAILAALTAGAEVFADIVPGIEDVSFSKLVQQVRSLGAQDRLALRGPAARGASMRQAWPNMRLVLFCRDTGDLEVIAPLVADGRVVVESPDADVLLAAAHLRPAGLVAVGEEAGGWTGAVSALILAQGLGRMAREHPAMPPWYLRGALGPAGAAAALAAGATGAVLDDALVLLEEMAPSGSLARLAEIADGTEATVIGSTLGAPLRVALHPLFPGARMLETRALAIEAAASDAAQARRVWIAAAEAALASGAVQPCGQGIAHAAAVRDRFGRIGPLVAHVRGLPRQMAEQSTALAGALGPDGRLARDHGCQFPIVQGPMTRVSDRPGFARAVAEAGALPMIALAALSAAESADLLEHTAQALGGLPWGAGLLGFLPEEQLAAQMAAVKRVLPPFVVLAGGRPDQALHLEGAGIRTYVHAPTPALAVALVRGGVRRLVLEGRECGGHVGPLHSLALWETVARELARDPAAPGLSVLLAGGIHDGDSAAIAIATVADLVAAGAGVGVLMGTAYLATDAITAEGAITPAFQQAVLDAQATVTVESGRGHANRCLPGGFADLFQSERRRLLAAATAPDAMRAALDGLLMGRLRLASKGLERQGGALVAVPPDRQRDEGMFMVGEVALRLMGRQSLAALHDDVSARGAARLAALAAAVAADAPPDPASDPATAAVTCDIAIVGMAVHLPGASDPQGFWRNVLDKTVSITEIPAERWDHRLFAADGPDAIAGRHGGFVDPMLFDPLRFGIPPRSVPDIAPGQLMALDLVRRAIDDAGYATRPFDRERTSVIIAAEDAGGFLGNVLTTRAMAPLVVDAAGVAEIRARTPGWSEESFPGLLTSVVAGRIANRFDFGGANFTVDSACASSLTALSLAASELASGRSSHVVLAGTDTTQTPYHYAAFTAVTALSRRGQIRAFDQSADGTVLAEGAAAFLLKRQSDAERDGDRIYAVIRSVACSSDGRGLGMTAPRPLGQKRALRRAHAALGNSVAALGFYEAHGTGTAVGDQAELESLGTLMDEAGANAESCAIGSVKALIGHTKTAAGAVGLAKTALALYHRTIPPQPGIDRPVARLGAVGSALFVADGAQPWLSPSAPRRAGVSAFGFGGTNAHVVLEEHPAFGTASPGGSRWPAMLVPVSARSRDGLRRDWALIARSAGPGHHAAPLEQIAAAACRQADPSARWRSAVVATSCADLRNKAQSILRHLDGETAPPPFAIMAEVPAERPPLAFLFPGQGSQKPQMCREAALYLPELRAALEEAVALVAEATGQRLDRVIYPPAAFNAETRAAQLDRLTASEAVQIAIGALSAGLTDFLARIGLRPDMVAGHSYGEFPAFSAAGVLDRPALLRLSLARGRTMAAAGPGRMAAVSADPDHLTSLLAGHPGVVLANINGPRQVVISGPAEAVTTAVAAIKGAGHACRMLLVGGAFHSPMMEGPRTDFARALSAEALAPARIPVVLSRPDEVASHIAAQMTAQVDWLAQVRALHAAGARSFVEVGPGVVLGHLTRAILADLPGAVTVRSLDEGGNLAGMLDTIARLWVEGQPFDPGRLLPGNTAVELQALAEEAEREPMPTSYFIDGMHVRPARPEVAHAHRSAEPLRNRDTPARRPSLTADPETAPQAAPQDGEPMSAQPTNDLIAAYSEYQATMRQFLATQEHVMRLMLGGEDGAHAMPVAAATARPDIGRAAPRREASAPATAPPPVATTVAVAAPPAPRPVAPAPMTPGLVPITLAPALDKPGVEDMVRALVSERTGYPADMIGLDEDIEAELGIDSIKRLEIFERLAARLPGPAAAAFRNRAEVTARERVLKAWVDAIMMALGLTGAGATPPFDLGAEAVAKAPAPSQPHDTCPAFVMTARRADLPPADTTALSGLMLVVPGPDQMTDAVLTALSDCGLSPVVAPADPTRLADAVAAARTAHGPVRGIIDLGGLGKADQPDLAAPLRLHRAVIACLPDLDALLPDRPRVFALSRMGGAFGRTVGGACPPATLASAIGGASLGYLNTLALEHPLIVARAIDLPARVSPGLVAQTLVAELAFAAGRIEVGHAPQGRLVFDVTAWAPRDTAESPPLTEDAVILATGGIRGITAAVLGAIARPGARLVILARSPAPGPADSATESAADASALRRLLAARAQTKDDRPQIAVIEAEVQAILRDRAARAALTALTAAGLRVEVEVADLCDPAAVARAMDRTLARHGRIDALVHGAGVIADRLLADKTADSFARVVDTKLAALEVLLTHPAASSYRHVLFFSSIAGRLGNRGQGDYAAANEALNRAALWLGGARPDVRVVSVNWGPWAGGGMATDAVNALFLQRGITPIPPGAGSALAAQLLAEPGPVEIIAGAGDWNRDLTAEPPLASGHPSPTDRTSQHDP